MNHITTPSFEDLTSEQGGIVSRAGKEHVFIYGGTGTGKTTIAKHWISSLLMNGVDPNQILLITPQKSYLNPYQYFFENELFQPFSIKTATINGIARRTIETYWPLVLDASPYSFRLKPPTFLTLETAQYYMMGIVEEKLAQGKFADIILDPNRLSSQLLDNLNKAALVGFDPAEIEPRLASAWSGDAKYLRAYADLRACVTEFRGLCVGNNLLDFSLQLEVFTNVLWKSELVRSALITEFPHLIIDNIEEDVPAAHDIWLEWIPLSTSTLAIYNTNGGYRSMLGADPRSGKRIFHACEFRSEFTEKRLPVPAFEVIAAKADALINEAGQPEFTEEEIQLIGGHIDSIYSKYFPDLIDQIAVEIARLIMEQNVPPSEIAVIAPYVGDTLITTLMGKLEQHGMPATTVRPSRAMVDDPLVVAFVTLAKLCYTDWQVKVTMPEFAKALIVLVDDFDLVRASLLASIVLRAQNELSEFELLKDPIRVRIGDDLGNKYELIRRWIIQQRSVEPPPLDIFIRKLFCELVAAPGFSLAGRSAEAGKIADLIESIRKFRQVIGEELDATADTQVFVGKEYVNMIQNGILTAAHGNLSKIDSDSELVIRPATTFLLDNRQVRYQFWLDIGSQGWFERVNQPLTHPYVLSRNWQEGRKWTDTDEFENNQKVLQKIFVGLTNLTKEKIYFCYSQYSESGFEQTGALLRAAQKIRH